MMSQVTVQKSAYQNVDQCEGHTNFSEQHNNSNSNININWQNFQQFEKQTQLKLFHSLKSDARNMHDMCLMSYPWFY